MKLVAPIKLLPTPEQARQLAETLEVANRAANYASAVAWEQKVFNARALQRLIYRELRAKYGLPSQIAVRVIAKVADDCKAGVPKQRVFRLTAAQALDDRLLRFTTDGRVSIRLFAGRVKIPVVIGDHQSRLFACRKGEADLYTRNGNWFLACTGEVPAEKEVEILGVLGGDAGIKNLLTLSDGTSFCGAHVRKVQTRSFHRRQRLQKRGTKAAKRKLRKLSGKERRFQKNTNHG